MVIIRVNYQQYLIRYNNNIDAKMILLSLCHSPSPTEIRQRLQNLNESMSVHVPVSFTHENGYHSAQLCKDKFSTDTVWTWKLHNIILLIVLRDIFQNGPRDPATDCGISNEIWFLQWLHS